VRAVVIKEFGGPEHLELVDVPEPVAEAGQAVVKLEYAGINFIDIYMRSGRYARSATYKTPLPMTLGMEGGGVVAALGPGASGTSSGGSGGSASGGRDAAGLRVGDRVAYCIVRGSYAEYAAVPAWRLSACLSAHSVLELPAGTVEQTRTAVGDELEVEKL